MFKLIFMLLSLLSQTSHGSNSMFFDDGSTSTYFSQNGGWTSFDEDPRFLGDVNGDGKMDIIGFDYDSGTLDCCVVIALSEDGDFGTPYSICGIFGPTGDQNNSWNSFDTYPRDIGDVNGDGFDDIVGFHDNGIYVSLSNGSHFSSLEQWHDNYSLDTGWLTFDGYPRLVGDFDGDGCADIIGFGGYSTYVTMSTCTKFHSNATVWTTSYARNQGWTSFDRFPRYIDDVNGDGKADMIAFGAGKLRTLISDGTTFTGSTQPTSEVLLDSNGWDSVDEYPKMVADVNGDGCTDMVGFGQYLLEIYVSTWCSGGYGYDRVNVSFSSIPNDFTKSAGWSSFESFPRAFGDVDGDGVIDIVGFGYSLHRAINAFIPPTPVPTPPPSSSPPSPSPTLSPSILPTPPPSSLPSPQPSPSPSILPIPSPSFKPTPSPSVLPTPLPTLEPSPLPTVIPSQIPTGLPTPVPSPVPTAVPTPLPTVHCSDPGTYFDVSLNQCKDCTAGRYGNVTGPPYLVDECTLCPAGQYNINTKQISCSDCASGKLSSPNRDYCADCEAGQYSRNATECVNCEEGKYAPQAQESECEECSAGSHTNNATKATTCTSCDGGKYSLGSVSECSYCARGKYSLSGASECPSCSTGFVAPLLGSSSCTACSAGTFANNETSSWNCTECPKGTYQGSTGQAACNECELGKYGDSVSASSCIACSAGTFANTTNSIHCFSCTSGQYQGSTGQSKCVDCDGGKYADGIEFTSCSNCVAGTFSNISAHECDSCSEGTFSSTGSSSCTLCVAGFMSQRAASSCLACDAGTFSALDGSANCSMCDSGSYSGNAADSCHACPAGFYTESAGSSSCLACDAGTFSASDGSANCSLCAAGYFSGNAADSCDACAAGFYTESAGSSSCLACDAGTFSALDGSANCSQCNAGSYSGNAADSCDACPAGFYTESAGSSSCLACDAGTFSASDGSANCSLCAAGYYSGNAADSCDACAAGFYAQSAGSGGCLSCDAGNYAMNASSTGCDQCAQGRYQGASGQSSCLPCDAGKAVASEGASSCVSCSAGKYSEEDGSTTCTVCDAGSYSSDGSTSCTECSVGTYNNVAGSTTCASCASNRDSSAGSTSCDQAITSYYISVVDDEAHACPNEAICIGGYYLPAPRTGYWSDRTSAEYLSSLYRCSRRTCKGSENGTSGVDITRKECWTELSINNKTCDSDELMCRQGAFGPLCGACESGYSLSNLECEECSANALRSSFIIMIIMLLIGIVILIAYSWGITLPGKLQQVWFIGIARNMEGGSLKILFSTYQILQSITYSLDVEYPSPFSNMLRFLGFINFNFATIDCAGIGVYDKVTLFTLAPIVVAAINGFILMLRLIIDCCRHHQYSRTNATEIKHQHTWFLLFLSYIVLPPVALVQFQALDCVELSLTSGAKFLRINTSVNCESSSHREFVLIDVLYIIITLSIPILWIIFISNFWKQLFPRGVTNNLTITKMRSQDSSLTALRFLFECYRVDLVYWEAVEMFRRILYVGVIPLLAASTLRRAAIGLGVSIVGVLSYREVMPYADAKTNFLAYVAQIVIFLTYGGSLVLETKLSSGLQGLTLGIALCAVNSVVLLFTVIAAAARHRHERAKHLELRSVMATKIEWACDFSQTKFNTTFEAIIESSVPPSHTLVCLFSSLYDVENMLKSGIPSKSANDGIVFTMNRPLHVLEDDHPHFSSFEACVVCSLPSALLFPLTDMSSASAIRTFPNKILRSLRGSYFGNISDRSLWVEGCLMLPPQCIRRAYRLEEDVIARSKARVSTTEKIHALSIDTPFSVMTPSRKDSLLGETKMLRRIDSHFEILSTSVMTMKPTTMREYLSTMGTIRLTCSSYGLVPLYHYTTVAAAPFILKSGLRMSTQGQGDGGIYFSTLGPANYDIGSPDYEDNLIIDCFGKERLSEYKGLHKLDVCLIYAVEPLILSQAPGGRENAKVVNKSALESFSLACPDGSYYLRPDHFLASFHLDPSNPPAGRYDDDIKIKLDAECEEDNEVIATIARALDEKHQNELLVNSFKNKNNASTIKVEWACGFSATKFKTSINAIMTNSVSSSNCLVFYYSSADHIEHCLAAGIPILQDRSKHGVVFTTQHPHNLSDAAKLHFRNWDCFLICSLPKRFLIQMDKEFKLLPTSILRAMRPTYFGNVQDPSPWIEGQLILSPNVILRAYRVNSNDSESISAQVPYELYQRNSSVADSDATLNLIHGKNASPVSLVEPKTCSEYVSMMVDIRSRCQAQNLVVLYHYTTLDIYKFILKSGLRMSTQGQGDGGVYFSTLGPASYDLGSDQYEDNIIIDCFGKERLEEYKGQHKLDVCLVYAAEPLMVEQAAGGRDNAKVVSKATFETFSLPHLDRAYYLRPDRVLGCFLIDPSRPIQFTKEMQFMIDNEKKLDAEVRTNLSRINTSIYLNDSASPQGLSLDDSMTRNATMDLGATATKHPKSTKLPKLPKSPLSSTSSPRSGLGTPLGSSLDYPKDRSLDRRYEEVIEHTL